MLKEKLLSYFRHNDMHKNTLYEFSSVVISSVCNFIALLLIIRLLNDPSEFGLFAIALAVLTMASDLSDLGNNAGIIRFASYYTAKGELEKVKKIFGIVLRAKLINGAVACLVIFLFAGPLSVYILKKPLAADYIKMAAFGVCGMLLHGFVKAVFQGFLNFRMSLVVNSILSGTRLLFIIALFFFSANKVPLILLAFIISPFISFFFGLFAMPKGMLDLRALDKGLAGEIFSFSKWIALSSFVLVINNNLAVFMLASLSSEQQVGLYALASKITYAFFLLVNAYLAVLYTKLSSLGELNAIKKTLKEALLDIGLLVGVIVVLGAIFIIIAPFIFSQQYLASMPILKLLLAGLVIISLSIPFSAVLFATQSHLFFTVNAIGLVVSFLLNLYFIPRFSALGCAYTNILANFTILLTAVFFVYFYVFRSFRVKAD